MVRRGVSKHAAGDDPLGVRRRTGDTLTDEVARLNASLSGRYDVEREVGAGGMAVVYLAKDLRHERQVAVKVLRPELAAVLGPERFLREIKTTAQLSHPHILALLDSGEADGLLYYVMPYVEGESLRFRLDRERQLPMGDAIRIAREVAGALSHAHHRGFIHRDIKPGNILLEDGHAVVTDFGIARAVSSAGDEPLTATGLAMGTPAYMSPEQATGDGVVDGRTDVYALGCVLYEMLTGEPPFTGPSAHAVILRHISERVPSAQLVRPAVTAALQRILDTALAKMPADRYATAAQFREALAAADGNGLPSPSESPHLGSAVSRMCDRWNQVNSFEALFREWRQRSPGRPQVYVVYGDDGNGHGSLVERLTATRIRQLAQEIAGEERGVVKKVRIPWPTRGDLDVRCRDLAISLFRELDPSYLGHDVSANALSGLSSLVLTPVVVIDQEILSRGWDGLTPAVLDWYWRSFWSEVAGGDGQPLFLVFIRVVLDRTERRFSMTAITARRRRKRVLDAISRLERSREEECPLALLDELGPVSVDDVREWFDRHGIYDSEQKRQELIESMFERSEAKPMRLIEAALAQVHRAFVQDVAFRRGQAL